MKDDECMCMLRADRVDDEGSLISHPLLISLHGRLYSVFYDLSALGIRKEGINSTTREIVSDYMQTSSKVSRKVVDCEAYLLCAALYLQLPPLP